MIFQQKCCSYYILLTDQISLSGYPYFLRYWAVCVLQLFVNQFVNVINFTVNLIFLIKPFLYIVKNSRQKAKCIENEKSF